MIGKKSQLDLARWKEKKWFPFVYISNLLKDFVSVLCCQASSIAYRMVEKREMWRI